MSTNTKAPSGSKYLDMQAYVGITKHNGGRAATNELLSLCHIDTAHEVLNVGCGIGVTSAYLARKYACRVAGVDISERMIAWSRKRARRRVSRTRSNSWLQMFWTCLMRTTASTWFLPNPCLVL